MNEFIEDLDSKPAAKIDHLVEEHLNGREPSAPPPEYPISSQVQGEMRELRVRFGKTRYRILFQRSDNLYVLLHAFEKNAGKVPQAEITVAMKRMEDFKKRMDAISRKPPRAAGSDAP